MSWVVEGLRAAGAEIVKEPDPSRAPFVLLLDLPWTGERLGIVGYLFTSTSRETRNRPDDEARFQIKYGSKPDENLHWLFADPNGLWLTVLWGIDLESGQAISVDPEAHNPTKFFVSVEYKRRQIEAIERDGWLAWTRDRRAWSRKDGVIQPIPEAQAATTETLVGATQEHLLRLLLFERAARGLTPDYRLKLAGAWKGREIGKGGRDTALGEHELSKMLGLKEEDIFATITGEPRLLTAVRGHAAERHLRRYLDNLPIVCKAELIKRDGQPDFRVRLKDEAGVSRTILIECKNTAPDTTRGLPKVDLQRTRAPIGNPCGRFYARDEFDVVAACLHPITSQWEFRFQATRRLREHSRCPGRINPNVLVDASWATDLAAVAAAL